MAARFWIGGGTNTNWNASPTTNWCATSGGSVRVAAPTSSDDVTFDGAGGGNSVSVVSANNSCLSLTFTSGYTSTITINNLVAITVAGNFTDNTAHSWSVLGSGFLAISAASTIISGGKTFPGPVTFSGANTKTLSTNDWTITGILTISAATVMTGQTLSIGGLTASSGCSGTTVIDLTGGIWSGGGVVQNTMTITGTWTASGSIAYNGGTLTSTSSSPTTTGSTLTISASTTLNTSAVSWNNIIISATSTITNNSLLTVTGTLTISAGATITFAGTTGFSVATLTISSVDARTHTLVNGVTYTITTAFNCFLSRIGAIVIFTSDDGTIKSKLTLNQGATCNVLASFTRIDASGGRTIFTFNGTLTTTTNIVSITDLSFVTGTSRVIQAPGNY